LSRDGTTNKTATASYKTSESKIALKIRNGQHNQ